MLCMVITSTLKRNETTQDASNMAPRWLYEFDGRGLFVASDFMERLRNGDAAALRALQKIDLRRPFTGGDTHGENGGSMMAFFTTASRRLNVSALREVGDMLLARGFMTSH